MTWIRSLSLCACIAPWLSAACGGASNDELFGGSGGAAGAQASGGASGNASNGGSSASAGRASGGTTNNSGGAAGSPSTTGGSSNAGTGGSNSTGGTSGEPNCDTLQAEANKALDAARACQPNASDQCEAEVDDLCGCDTRVARGNSEATEAYQRAKGRFEKAGCNIACFACLDVGNPGCAQRENPRCSRGLGD